MIQAPDLPPWAALIVAVLVLLGSSATLIGSFGLVRLKTFYERVHSPTLGATVGVGCMVLAAIVCFTSLQSHLVLHELLIFVFVSLTTPVTLMLLVRASLYRDRVGGSRDVPPDGPSG